MVPVCFDSMLDSVCLFDDDDDDDDVLLLWLMKKNLFKLVLTWPSLVPGMMNDVL